MPRNTLYTKNMRISKQFRNVNKSYRDGYQASATAIIIRIPDWKSSYHLSLDSKDILSELEEILEISQSFNVLRGLLSILRTYGSVESLFVNL